MLISDTAVQQRITVFVLTVLLVAGGLYSYLALPREAAPEVDIPVVLINTTYRGVSPEDMESSVTKEIEEKLKGLEGVDEIRSTSAEGLSTIQVEFLIGADIDDAVQKVKDKVDLAKSELPTDLDDDPVVKEVSSTDWPIYICAISGPAGPIELRRIAERLEEKMEGVPGVLEVDVAGGLEREIHIEVNLNRISLYAVPYTQLMGVVSGENANLSGGNIRGGASKLQLRQEGEFEAVEEIERVVVDMPAEGSPVYLRDVATVIDGFKDRQDTSRLDGDASVTLSVKKRGGENIIEIVEGIEEVLAEDRMAWPPGTRVTRMVDESDNIRMMVADLENNIISGLLLVIAVVCVAMGLRNAVLVSLSIPLSMLIGFIILRVLGVTLNMVVLFSLTLALGMLVDNAIVIVENIYRFMQQGVPRLEAAMRATSEVAYPIVGSGLTTIGAFVPLLFWTGIMGEFMVYLPTTVIAVLSSCLFVALVINPAMAAVVMRVKRTDGDEAPRSAEEVMSGTDHPMLHEGGAIIRAYRSLLASAIGYDIPRSVRAEGRWQRFTRHLFPLGPRLAVLVLAGLVFVAAFLFWVYGTGLHNPMRLFPNIDPPYAEVKLETPEGADISYCDAVVRNAEMRVFSEQAARLAHQPDLRPSYEDAVEFHRYVDRKGRAYESPSDIENVEHVSAQADAQGGNNKVTVLFPDYDERTVRSIHTLEDVRQRMEGFTGAKWTVEEPDKGPPTGAAVNVEISGSEMRTLGELAEEVKRLLGRVPFVRNIRDDYAQGAPTLSVRVNRKRAAFLGLSSQTIGATLKAAINGIEVSTYRENDEDYDIVVRLEDRDRRVVGTLERLGIPSPTHGIVPLTTVATIDYEGGLGKIHRIDHDRVVTVQADVNEEKTSGDTARRQAEKLLSGSPLFEAGAAFRYEAFDPDAKGPPPAVKLPAAVAPALPEGLSLPLRANTEEELLVKINRFVETFDPADDLRTELISAVTPAEQADAEGAPARERLARLGEYSRRIAYEDDAQQRFNRLLLECANPGTFRAYEPGLELPTGYTYRFTGEAEHQAESQAFLTRASLLAIGIIFLILVSQFNSIVFPFIILSSVLLSLTGVFLGLALYDEPFVLIMTGVGCISLAGVVVNNAIVLIDYTRQLIDRGMPRDRAILAAGCTRLRPVILTAITTVLGLVPMVTGASVDFHPLLEGSHPVFQLASESSQWWRPMAIAVVFGMLVATALTLVVVPVLFSLLDDLRALGARFFVKIWTWLQQRFARIRAWYWRLFRRLTGIKTDR